MNILIIPSWYNKENNEGIFFLEQAIALKKAGHDVTMLYLDFFSMRNIFNSPNIREYNDNGVNIIIYPKPSWFSYRLNISQHVYNCYYKKALLFANEKYGNFDLIHAHSFSPAGYGVAKNKNVLDIPLVVTEHSSLITVDGLDKRHINYLKYTLDNVDRFLSVSNYLRDEIILKTNTDVSIDTIHNLVNSNFRFDNNSKKFSSFTFLTVGNLIPLKNHIKIIEIFTEEFYNKKCKLLICGNGQERENLEKFISENNIGDKVKLLGNVSREELAMLMNKVNALIHFSKKETFGVVLIEALASGLPVIGTLCGGSNEILLNSYGAIPIEVDDVDALKEKMLMLYNNETRYDNYKISEEALAKYSEETVVNKLNQIYESVLYDKETY